MQKKLLNFEEFRTFACYIASVINDRPLTYIYSDINSECKALSPNMLIFGYNKRELPHLRLHRPEDKIETKITESFKIMNRLKDRFWTVWNRQYLTDLYERHSRDVKARGGGFIVPKIGEIVLINGDKQPRRNWQLGRVVEIVEKRGSIREVVVQTLSPGKNVITKLKRSPDKLVPIGVSSDIERLNENKLIPLENAVIVSDKEILENEEVSKKASKKYTKSEIAIMEKCLGLWGKKSKYKIWPPYTCSKSFLDSKSINTGPNPEYVDTGGALEGGENMLREWRR